MDRSVLTSGLIGPITFTAGGLVWRRTKEGLQIALVHRPSKGGDWSLPKGKFKDNESLLEAARREVKEETGYDVRLLNFAGTAHYYKKDKIKVAFYWNMEAEGKSSFQPSKEVEKMEWLSPQDALKRLTFPIDQELLARCLKK